MFFTNYKKLQTEATYTSASISRTFNCEYYGTQPKGTNYKNLINGVLIKV